MSYLKKNKSKRLTLNKYTNTYLGPIDEIQPVDNTVHLDIDDKNNSGYWVRKGENRWIKSKGSNEDALIVLDYFNRAIKLNPLNYVAWTNKGLILKKLNQRENAISCYNRAITIKPDYLNSWINKGVLLGCIGRIQEAIDCFEKVLKFAPDNELAQREKQMLEQMIKQRQYSKIIVKSVKNVS
jgi:tetratricopeptide (TPR) repeat protein